MNTQRPVVAELEELLEEEVLEELELLEEELEELLELLEELEELEEPLSEIEPEVETVSVAPAYDLMSE